LPFNWLCLIPSSHTFLLGIRSSLCGRVNILHPSRAVQQQSLPNPKNTAQPRAYPVELTLRWS
jgi:hypothetical protein